MKNRWFTGSLLALTILIGLLAIPVLALAEEKVQEWELINPAGIIKIEPIKMAARLNTLEGKTVGLKWNQKPNGNLFLDRVAELLTTQVKNVKIIKFYETEPTTVPQSANQEDSKRKAKIIASYKPDIVIGSQCD